jgi:hypothetical protein
MYPTSLCLNFGFPTLLGCDGPLVVIRDVEAYGPVLVQLRRRDQELCLHRLSLEGRFEEDSAG